MNLFYDFEVEGTQCKRFATSAKYGTKHELTYTEYVVGLGNFVAWNLSLNLWKVTSVDALLVAMN